ncbi:MAG TPA: hypothetical protein VN285_01025 [Candidatus Deferrimicrobium sp.]|nr:hypothetical protein [Candidatus Deferrimicrobium sp.]
MRILIAAVVAAGMLYIARLNSQGRPEFISRQEHGFTFEMTTVPKAPEDDSVRIEVRIVGQVDRNLRAMFRASKPLQTEKTNLRLYSNTPLQVVDSAGDLYAARAATGTRGGRLLYYFEIRDQTGGQRARFTQPDGRPFEVRFIGHIPPLVLITHVGLMALTVFFVVMAAISAVGVVRGVISVRSMAIHAALAAICAFFGGYPIGMAMNHYAFNTIWEGVPFGTDATDNKTQLLFAYLLFVSLASVGSVTNNKFGKDLFSPQVLGWFGIGTFALMFGIYLIPHSSQFGPGLTTIVCYAFLGALALLLLVRVLQTRLAAAKAEKSARASKRP